MNLWQSFEKTNGSQDNARALSERPCWCEKRFFITVGTHCSSADTHWRIEACGQAMSLHD